MHDSSYDNISNATDEDSKFVLQPDDENTTISACYKCARPSMHKCQHKNCTKIVCIECAGWVEDEEDTKCEEHRIAPKTKHLKPSKNTTKTSLSQSEPKNKKKMHQQHKKNTKPKPKKKTKKNQKNDQHQKHHYHNNLDHLHQTQTINTKIIHYYIQTNSSND